MSYTPGTIIKRKKPFKEDDELACYNELRVVGYSARQAAIRTGEWEGQGGDEITVTPTTFGAVVDRPAGELERDYTIVSIPDREQAILPPKTVTRADPGPSPEEVFRKQALQA